jgi:hypothetical protein
LLDSDQWTQVGSAIQGETSFDFTGTSVALSGDGQRFVVSEPGFAHYGRVRTFDWSSATQDWSEAEPIWECCLGSLVALSTDGLVLATLYPAGNRAQIYDWKTVGTAWNRTRSDILYAGGESLAMSSSGDLIIIGRPAFDGPAGTASGQAAVFEYKNNEWGLVGSLVNGATTAGERFGEKVAISGGATTRVAVSSLNNDATGTVRIYEEVAGAFHQIGQQIQGSTVGEEFGASLAFSQEGNRLVVGSPFSSSVNGATGSVQTFDYTGIDWVLVTADLIYGGVNSTAGTGLALSPDGLTVVVGAPETAYLSAVNIVGKVSVHNLSSSTPVTCQAAAGPCASDAECCAAPGFVAECPAGFCLHSKPQQQVGQDIYGFENGDEMGYACAISSLGTRIVAAARSVGKSIYQGRVRIFDLQGSYWIRNGSTLAGEVSASYTVESVALSGNGERVAILEPLRSTLITYEWTLGDWAEVATITGSASDVVRLSFDGTRLAFLRNNRAEVFDWGVGGVLTLIGDPIYYGGQYLAMSSLGDRLIIGHQLVDGPAGTDSGQAAVYQYNSTAVNWDLVGSLIDGATTSGELFGSAVAMSADGTRVAIASSAIGVIRVYDEKAGSWNLTGQEISGTPGEGFGMFFCLRVESDSLSFASYN